MFQTVKIGEIHYNKITTLNIHYRDQELNGYFKRIQLWPVGDGEGMLELFGPFVIKVL